MSNTIRRVFISHTSEFREFPENASFIAAAIKAVNRAGGVPTDMEYFTARDEKPAEYCKKRVRECDVYVGVIGLRYGSPVRDRQDVSYTELEFEVASETPSITRLIFLLEPMSTVPAALFVDPKYHDRQEAFRKRLSDAGVMCKPFRDAHQLEMLIYQALIELGGARVDPAEPMRIDWPEGKSPYPGLLSFDQEYADLFFGREREVNEIIAKMSEPQGRFLIISGASGSGKSSVVGAGVWRALIREERIPGSRKWEWLRIQPGDGTTSPFEALTWGLKQTSLRFNERPDKLAGDLRSEGGLAPLVTPKLTEGKELVLFVDQLEELFTTGFQDDDVNLFLSQLVASSSDRTKRIRIIGTIRSEFIGRLEESESILRLLNEGYNYHLGSVSPRILQEMIEKPAAATGYEFEPNLVEQILTEAAQQPGSLPLVAYTLSQLFERRRDRTFTRDAYQAIGGVAGAIGTQADQTTAGLKPEEAGAFDRVFAELVHIERERPPTRKVAQRASFMLDDPANSLIDALAGEDCRVLVTGVEKSEPTVEVAHEKLFSAWPKLDNWIKSAGDALRLIDHATEAVERWQNRGENSEELWSPSAAAEVLSALERFGKEPSPILDRFLRPQQVLEKQLHQNTLSHDRRLKIGAKLGEYGDLRKGVGVQIDGLPEIEWIDIPRGKVKLETEEGAIEVDVNPSRIAKYPVTNAQFQAFIDAEDGYRNSEWWRGIKESEEPAKPRRSEPNSPRENVNWFEAVAFSRWLSKRTGLKIRLPTEWEWQQAATGGDPNREYPWPGGWDASKCNSLESRLDRTTAVGMYPEGATQHGVLDMAGNVWEWCLNKLDDPGSPDSLRIDDDVGGRRVLRGGSWNNVPVFLRASYRVGDVADLRDSDIGFRLAQDID